MTDIDANVTEVERLEADKAGDIWVYRDGYYRTAVPLLAAECKRLRHTVETKVPALETAMVMQSQEIAWLRKTLEAAKETLSLFSCNVGYPNQWCPWCKPSNQHRSGCPIGKALTCIAELEAQRGEKA